MACLMKCFVFLALIGIIYMISMMYKPAENGSIIAWTCTRVKGGWSTLHNVSRGFAEIFCNKPDECKDSVNWFFEAVPDFLRDILEGLVGFMRKSSNKEEQGGGSVQKNLDLAKMGAVDFTQETTDAKGNELKAEKLMKSLTFSRYDENNLCDLKEGIPDDEYDATVEEIAELTSMPKKLKKTIKRARKFKGGNVLAVNKVGFKADDGSLVFGRIAVIRRGKVLDMAYSLHSVEYELLSKHGNAENLEQFSESLDDENDDKAKGNAKKGISMELRNDFITFFHKQAIEGFVKRCDYVLKTMNHGEDVVRALGVEKNGEAAGEEKEND